MPPSPAKAPSQAKAPSPAKPPPAAGATAGSAAEAPRLAEARAQLSARLTRRATKEELVSSNILRAGEDETGPVATVSPDLGRALKMRPGAQELARRGILQLLPEQVSSPAAAKENHRDAPAAASAPEPLLGVTDVPEELLLAAPADETIPIGGVYTSSVAVPSAGALFLQLETPVEKPTDLTLRFEPSSNRATSAGNAQPAAGDASLAAVAGAVRVPWRADTAKSPSSSALPLRAAVAACAGVRLLRLHMEHAGTVHLSFAHVSTAWLWDSATPLRWSATLEKRRPLMPAHIASGRAPPAPLPSTPPRPGRSLPLVSSPLVPTAADLVSATSYDEQMARAVDEALAIAMRATRGGACRAGASSLVGAGLATSSSPSPALAKAPAATATLAKAAGGKGSGRLSTSLTITPVSPRDAVAPLGAAEAVEDAESAFGSLLESAAAMRLQGQQRVRLAKQLSEERRLFAAASHAATEAKMAEMDERALQAEEAAAHAYAQAQAVQAANRLAKGAMDTAVAADEAARRGRTSEVGSPPRVVTTPRARERATPASASTPASAASTPAGSTPAMSSAPLPLSALALLDELRLAKYGKRFLAEDLTETTMFTAMLELESGASDLRAILREVGMSVGHRERMLLALTTRPEPEPDGGQHRSCIHAC